MFKIVGFKEGKGCREKTVVWQCETPDGKETFWVYPIGSQSHRGSLYLNAESHVGSLLTVCFQELHESGVPRFPVGKGIREIF